MQPDNSGDVIMNIISLELISSPSFSEIKSDQMVGSIHRDDEGECADY